MLEILSYTRYVTPHVPPQSLLHVLTAEQVSSREKVEKKGAQAKNIGLIAIALVMSEHLWGNIAGGSTFVRKTFIFWSKNSESEICNPYFIL